VASLDAVRGFLDDSAPNLMLALLKPRLPNVRLERSFPMFTCPLARTHSLSSALVLSLALGALGCNSPYRSDKGALVGGLGGAGLGAIVGNAVGNTGAGAAIGAGVGALSGAAIGGSLDDIEAQNRAEIEARMGRPAPAGAVSIADVISMTRAGVSEDVIIPFVQSHGMAQPIQAQDLIALQQQGVSPRVMQAMQAPPQAAAPVGYAQPVVVGQPVVVPGPVYYPAPCYYRPYPRPGVSWGLGFGGPL
jgi:outer membrane lipoprotein SlyB